MDNMDYTTFYDVSQQNSFSMFPWIVLLLPAVGVLFLYQNRNSQNLRQIFITVWLFGAFLGSLLFIVIALVTDSHYASIVRQGQCSTLTGAIENFTPPPRDRKPSYESFTLQNVQFAYDDALHTGAFNATGAWNNLLRNGLHVRICYAWEGSEPQDKRILKLEVRNDDLVHDRPQQ